MPPRRQPTLPPTGSEEPAASAEDPQDVDLDMVIENLSQQVEENRKRSRIATLRAELAGKGRKRGPSVDSSMSQAKHMYIRVKEPTIYEGKSLRKYREYAAMYNTYFTVIDGDELDRIELAATYLRGNALSIWVSKEAKPEM